MPNSEYIYVYNGDYKILNRHGNFDDGVNRSCTLCGKHFRKTSKTVTLCNECNSTRVKSQPYELKMWRRAKNRSTKSGIPFTIDVDDIIIPEVCPILGIKIKENKGKPGAYKDSPSLDKINPTLGYVKGNVQVISQMANQMKFNATPQELITFANYILKHYDLAQPNELC